METFDSLSLQERNYLDQSRVIDHLVSTTITMNAFVLMPGDCAANKAAIENALLELNTAPLPPRLAVSCNIGEWATHINNAAIECLDAMDAAACAIEQQDPDLAAAAAKHMRAAHNSLNEARQLVRFD